ncbi:MAG: tetratricopeptide repeat protein [Lentisphaeria bacterium]|nr:tetratricopeptide repeat protein [Lentisphaeria bacterium]
MQRQENEQHFPLTALIIILVFIVLASLLLMSVRSALPPSPIEKKDTDVLKIEKNVEMEPVYFYPTALQNNPQRDTIMIPPDFGTMVVKSMDHYDIKEYDKAEDLLRTLHLFYPKSALVAHLLGNTLFAKKQFKEAEYFYMTSLRLSNANNPLLYNNLAMSLAMQGNYNGAIINMKKAISYGKDILPKAEWNLAALYLRAGRKEDSLKLFLSLLHKTPADHLKDIAWDPVFEPLFLNDEVKKILKDKTGKDHRP